MFHVKKQEYDLIRKMVKYAFNKGVKVHGLGFTKTKELNNYKFYSVDSASFTKGAALGQQKQTFNGKFIESRRIDGKGKKIKLSNLVMYNFYQWCNFQKYMDNKKWR